MDDDDIEWADSPMQRCVDGGDVDGLLAIVSPDQIAIAWNRCSAAPGAEMYGHPDWWAIELFLGEEIFQRIDLYRHLLLKLVEHATEDTLGAVAAGPLENFVSDDEDDLRWIESQCKDNPQLRTALTGMWSFSYVSEATMLRLDAAAGQALPRPLPRSEWSPELFAIKEAEERVAEVVPGGMVGYGNIGDPTEEQRAAVAAYRAALKVLTDRRAI